MYQKMERGKSVNKLDDLRKLTKAWWLATKKDDSGELAEKTRWDEAVMTEHAWGSKSQKIDVVEDLQPWGIIIGRFGGEELALKAMDRGEIVERAFKTSSGAERTMYAVVSANRTPGFHFFSTFPPQNNESK